MSPYNFADLCISAHKNTNHYYDKYLPYEFHLRMVIQVFQDFKHLIPGDMREIVEKACWGHDLIEDTRVSYSDIVKWDCQLTADLIYAVTNEKGRNREERANSNYYTGIKSTQFGVFVKLCDRIANIQYSKLTKSRMFELYKKENREFDNRLFNREYEQMFLLKDKLLESM